MSISSDAKVFDDSPVVEVGRDLSGHVQSLDHIQDVHPPGVSTPGDASPEAVSRKYLRETIAAYGIPSGFLRDTSNMLTAQQSLPDDRSVRLQLAETRKRFKSIVVTYQQTALGLPVWKSSLDVVLANPMNSSGLIDDQASLKPVSSHSTVKPDMALPKEPSSNAKALKDVSPEQLAETLDLDTTERRPTINKQSLIVYRYDARARVRDHSDDPEAMMTESHSGPSLSPLPVPGNIVDGAYYVVREVLFTWTLERYVSLNWRVFLEVESGRAIYLRALVAGWGMGYVYTKDPVTRIGAGAPAATSRSDADLHLVRENVILPGLVRSTPQKLLGQYVEVVDLEPPYYAAPVSATGDFDYHVPTPNFAGVNAYHQMEYLFHLMERLGFDVRGDLFDSSKFPLPVDHRGFNDQVNAQAPGNPSGNGSGGFIFGVAAPSSQVPMAADFRVAAHEFGHALLWEAVRSPNFGFAHSAGDAIGAIHCDPDSRAPDRFDTFPWSPVVRRRHDRSLKDGWAWGGPKSADPQYNSEQILSTTLFRMYRALGGDSIDMARRVWASDYALFLLVGGIASLTTQSRTADPYVTAMMLADNGTILGHAGGAARKVIRWSFEMQGLFQPPLTTGQVFTRGAPPPVDVFIDDGRNGEYDWHTDFDQAPGIWNRHAADHGMQHQSPVANVSNYCYARIKNRGTLPAVGLVVNAYQTVDISTANWPADFTLMTDQSNSVMIISAGGSTVVGPFRWTPAAITGTQRPGILFSVSAAGDVAITETSSGLTCANFPGGTPIDQLVRYDNNLALRAV